MVKVPITIQNKKTWIHQELKTKLDNGVNIINKNWDLFFLIDGIERSGKSTLGITCASYLADQLGVPFTLDNIAKDSADAKEKLEKLPDKSVLLIDEGSLLFSSKDTMRKESKEIEKICNVIGQKNMVFIIVLPSFFRLNDYLAIDRSRFLLHVYTDENLTRGKFVYFGETKKRLLYEKGKKFKSYSSPSGDWVGDYPDFDLFGEEYKKIKKDTLFGTFHNKKDKENTKLDKYKLRYETAIKQLLRMGFGIHNIEKLLIEVGAGIDRNELISLSKESKSEKQKPEKPNILISPKLYYNYPKVVENGTAVGG